MIKLRTGYDRNYTVRLPEGKTKIDTSKPVGAALTGTIIRTLKNCVDMEDIGNALTLYSSLETVDNSSQKQVVIGHEESYVLVNGAQTTTVTDSNAMNGLLANGWTLKETITKEILG